MVQATTDVAEAPIGHPGTLTLRRRQRIANSKYKKSERYKRRRKLLRCGLSRDEVDAIIRAEFPKRATGGVCNG